MILLKENSPEWMALRQRLTSKLVAAGRVLDVELLDHVIYSSRGFLSLREHDPRLFEHGGDDGAPAEPDGSDSPG